MGLTFCVVCFVILALRVVQALVQRDWVSVTRLISARSLEEEIAEETQHAQAELEREHQLQARHGS